MEWFEDWIDRHRADHGDEAPGLDDEGLRWYENVRRGFANANIPEAAALEASRRLQPYGLSLTARLRRLVELAVKAAAADPGAGSDHPAERDDAEALCRSKGCECGGSGLVSVRVRTRRVPTGEHLAVACPGPAGRWLRERRNRESDPRLRLVGIEEVHPDRFVAELPDDAVRYANVAEMWRAIKAGRIAPDLRASRADEAHVPY